MAWNHSKYHNQSTPFNGQIYMSKKEADYAQQLYLARFAKEPKERVTKVRTQVPFVLQEGLEKNGHKIREIKYLADFVVEYGDGHTEVVDVKGMKTDVYKLKRKLFEARFPELTIKEV